MWCEIDGSAMEQLNQLIYAFYQSYFHDWPLHLIKHFWEIHNFRSEWSITYLNTPYEKQFGFEDVRENLFLDNYVLFW